MPFGTVKKRIKNLSDDVNLGFYQPKIVLAKYGYTQKRLAKQLDISDASITIFDLPNASNIEVNIGEWMKKAGVEKHITYHCSRHTFATLQFTAGSDIYTTSKLLGHSSVATTAIYAEVIMDKKIDAVSRIDKLFGNC